MPKKQASSMNIGITYGILVSGFPEIRGGAVIIRDFKLCCLCWGPHLWELELDCLPIFSNPEKTPRAIQSFLTQVGVQNN